MSELFRVLFGATSGRMRVPALRMLIEAYPESVTVDALVAALWPTHPPADPTVSARILMSTLRRDLAAHGWTVSMNVGGSAPGRDREGVKARYRLVRLP